MLQNFEVFLIIVAIGVGSFFSIQLGSWTYAQRVRWRHKPSSAPRIVMLVVAELLLIVGEFLIALWLSSNFWVAFTVGAINAFSFWPSNLWAGVVAFIPAVAYLFNRFLNFDWDQFVYPRRL